MDAQKEVAPFALLSRVVHSLSMKLHPFRAAHVGRSILRDRMIAEIAKSPAGQRVIRECQAALDLPVNSDEISRKLVLNRFADELDLYPHELEELLARKASDRFDFLRRGE
jgi:hypothetical protein